MKHFLWIGVCMLAFSVASHAQDVRFGLKAGVNNASATGFGAATASITSFHLGGTMEARYSKAFALQPEIVYSQQGFETGEGSSKESYRFSYINIPVMAKYFVVDGFFLEAGPQIGYLNTAKWERQTQEGSEKSDIKEAMRDNDLSLNLGLGFQLKNGWSLTGRYQWGLTNLVRRELDRNFRNSVLQISLGYFF